MKVVSFRPNFSFSCLPYISFCIFSTLCVIPSYFSHWILLKFLPSVLHLSASLRKALLLRTAWLPTPSLGCSLVLCPEFDGGPMSLHRWQEFKKQHANIESVKVINYEKDLQFLSLYQWGFFGSDKMFQFFSVFSLGKAGEGQPGVSILVLLTFLCL